MSGGGIVIHRSRHAQEFVILPNYIARDGRLSFRARGLLAMLLSLPPDWHMKTDALSQDNPEGRDQIRAAMKELREAGYVVLKTERGKDGRTRRHLEVFDTPQQALEPSATRPAFGATRENNEFPQVAPNAEKPSARRPARISKTGEKERKQTPPTVPPEAGAVPVVTGSVVATRGGELDSLSHGMTGRERAEILRMLTDDPHIRSAAAVFKSQVADGTIMLTLEQARANLARGDLVREAFADMEAREAERAARQAEAERARRATCHWHVDDETRRQGYSGPHPQRPCGQPAVRVNRMIGGICAEHVSLWPDLAFERDEP